MGELQRGQVAGKGRMYEHCSFDPRTSSNKYSKRICAFVLHFEQPTTRDSAKNTLN